MKGLKIYGDAEGPLGFPMPSELAKELELLLKSLNVDCKSFIKEFGEDGLVRRKVAPAKFEVLVGERADISLITTDTVDRDREVVYPQGGDWKGWQKSGGVVTFAHRYDALPVGRGLWIKRVQEPANGWLAKTLYKSRPDNHPQMATWFPDEVFAFVQDGMRGKSIGFVPVEYRKPNEKEIEERPELAGIRGVVPKWLGLEYAVAPIQSNPDAVAITVGKMRQKGFTVSDVVMEEMGVVVPEGAEVKAETKPTPKENETQPDFQARCMAFPDLQGKPEAERAAVCSTLWADAHKSATPPTPKVLTPEEGAYARTPAELEREAQAATLAALQSLDVSAIVADTIDQLRGRV